MDEHGDFPLFLRSRLRVSITGSEWFVVGSLLIDQRLPRDAGPQVDSAREPAGDDET